MGLRKKFQYVNMTDWAWHKMRKVRWAMIDICPTWKCNVKCPTCQSWQREKNELSIEQAKQIVYNPLFKHLNHIMIEGGEPTLWSNLNGFLDILFIEKEHAIINMITNGVLVKRIQKIGERYAQYKERFKFYVSLNGPPEIHNASRAAVCYDKTVESARILKDMGYKVQFSCLTFDQNLDNVQYVVDLGAKMGITIGTCYSTNYGRFNYPGDWTTDRKEDTMCTHRKTQGRMSFLNNWAYDYFLSHVSDKKIMPCYAGYRYVHINPDGVLRPCLYDETMVVGIVIDDDVLIDSLSLRNCLKRIPKECQYNDGWLCNDYLIRKSVRSNIGRVIGWKLRKSLS